MQGTLSLTVSVNHHDLAPNFKNEQAGKSMEPMPPKTKQAGCPAHSVVVVVVNDDSFLLRVVVVAAAIEYLTNYQRPWHYYNN